MLWSNITEKASKSVIKVYYEFKSAWKHSFLIILCSFRRLKSKVNDIFQFWGPRCDCVTLKTVL